MWSLSQPIVFNSFHFSSSQELMQCLCIGERFQPTPQTVIHWIETVIGLVWNSLMIAKRRRSRIKRRMLSKKYSETLEKRTSFYLGGRRLKNLGYFMHNFSVVSIAFITSALCWASEFEMSIFQRAGRPYIKRRPPLTSQLLRRVRRPVWVAFLHIWTIYPQ